MAIRKKKKINPKYKVRRATQIRIIIVVILLIVVINNYNFYTGIPVVGNLSNGGIVAELENDIYYITYSDAVESAVISNRSFCTYCLASVLFSLRPKAVTSNPLFNASVITYLLLCR